ncbi:helix-turn-helix domain-containing protein [Mycobacteroides abscessus]|uniref:helix-turn-helix domain-containing protein n=1 Tax=Mycobacteroides abscessus TaxID=36809 RepID=UPI001F351A3E|nr:helix-turn-helix domain-containing protein [Mycobacteroides abscessus]
MRRAEMVVSALIIIGEQSRTSACDTEHERIVMQDDQASRAALLSIPDAQVSLGGIGRTMIYQLIQRGEIVKVNVGRRGFITRKSLDAYIDRLTAA